MASKSKWKILSSKQTQSGQACPQTSSGTYICRFQYNMLKRSVLGLVLGLGPRLRSGQKRDVAGSQCNQQSLSQTPPSQEKNDLWRTKLVFLGLGVVIALLFCRTFMLKYESRNASSLLYKENVTYSGAPLKPTPFKLRRDCQRLLHIWEPPFELCNDSRSLVNIQKRLQQSSRCSKTPVVCQKTFSNPRCSSAEAVEGQQMFGGPHSSSTRCQCLDIGIRISNMGFRMLGIQ